MSGNPAPEKVAARDIPQPLSPDEVELFRRKFAAFPTAAPYLSRLVATIEEMVAQRDRLRATLTVIEGLTTDGSLSSIAACTAIREQALAALNADVARIEEGERPLLAITEKVARMDPCSQAQHVGLRLEARRVIDDLSRVATAAAGRPYETPDDFLARHIQELRRRLVGTPPNVDGIDAAIASILDDCEAQIKAVSQYVSQYPALAASDEAARPERTEYTPLSNDYGDDEP